VQKTVTMQLTQCQLTASIQDNGRSTPSPKSNVNVGMEGSSYSALNLRHARPEVGTGGRGERIGGEVG